MGITMSRTLSRKFKCFSVSMLRGSVRNDIEKGGKIIMPPSVLEFLSIQNIVCPMLFKIKNRGKDKTSHCGVLEFVADEGNIYIPQWMMHNLFLEEGEEVIIESVSLPTATYSCFQPQSTDFLDISNPKAVLENCLRNFACLTTGDVISIMYNGKNYELNVLEALPGGAVNIIECDMNVDFAAPPGYNEDSYAKASDACPSEAVGFTAFSGTGCRLDGKKNNKGESSAIVPSRKPHFERGRPDYSFQMGTVTFIRIGHADLSPSSPVLEDTFPGMGVALSENPAGVIHSEGSSNSE